MQNLWLPCSIIKTMISKITGKITHSDINFVVIDVGGVGYKVFVCEETLDQIRKIGNETEKDINLWTHLAVRENSMDLYGFETKENLELFEMLISVSGIGPKSGLNILNIASPDSLRSAVISGDTQYLTKVSGIGKKNAQKIILELKDKLGEAETGGFEKIKEETEAVEALKSLGYSSRESREALRQVQEAGTTQEKIREALKILGS